jgi:hypothetical protein
MMKQRQQRQSSSALLAIAMPCFVISMSITEAMSDHELWLNTSRLTESIPSFHHRQSSAIVSFRS